MTATTIPGVGFTTETTTIEHLDFEACCEGKIDGHICEQVAICMAKSKCEKCGAITDKLYCKGHLKSLKQGNFVCYNDGNCGGFRFYVTHTMLK